MMKKKVSSRTLHFIVLSKPYSLSLSLSLSLSNWYAGTLHGWDLIYRADELDEVYIMSVINNVFKTLPTWTESWKLTRFFCFCFFFNFSLFWVKISYGKLIRFLYLVTILKWVERSFVQLSKRKYRFGVRTIREGGQNGHYNRTKFLRGSLRGVDDWINDILSSLSNWMSL